MLLLDTSGREGSLALAEVRGEGRVLQQAALPGRSASERLFPELRELLRAGGMGLEDLCAISVVLGPGSFTGVRIGVAAAKGLAEGSGVPVIGLSRLAILQEAARRGREETVAVLLDAGRGEAFCGLPDGREALVRDAEVAELCGSARICVFEAAVGERVRPVVTELLPMPDAGAALAMALRRLRAGEFAAVETLDAHYLRRTAAEDALRV